MNLILFLGAGVSRPSGLPTAEKLTAIVLEAGFDQQLFQGEGLSSDQASRISKLFKLLHTHDTKDIKEACYYIKGNTWESSGAIFRGKSTYEDIFFLCQQMKLWDTGLVDNSLITPFMTFIQELAGDFLRGASFKARMCDLSSLASLGCNFMEAVVAASLKPDCAIGLDLIRELALSPDVGHLDIVTLNHDTLAEHVLLKAGVTFVNGFGPPDGDIRWFDDQLFDGRETKTRVLKLHGSVDWFTFVVEGLGRPAMLDANHTSNLHDQEGRLRTPLFKRPSFLSGLHKAVSYQRGIYADIHFRYQESLRRCDKMIMSGYGWGDTAINFQLEKWLDRREPASLLLLHEDPTELVGNSLVLASGFDGWIRSKRLVSIKKWMSDVTLDELRPNFAKDRKDEATIFGSNTDAEK